MPPVVETMVPLPDRRRRQLVDLVSDLEVVLDRGEVPGPYVLVGTSGGGYISVGYAVRHPKDVAGMVFVEVPTPFFDAPREVVEANRWNSPENIESRDFLQVEKDAWAARRRIGDIPFILLSNEYSASEIAAAEFPVEKKGMRAQRSSRRRGRGGNGEPCRRMQLAGLHRTDIPDTGRN